ncbi:MAG: histidinol-phosphate transaminase [Dehalococcoidales bacterium]|nr:histidinol-phosphate transaminase [Dehalococcoidales bacterium]
MSLEPRPEISLLKAGVHGGINHAELAAMGIDPGTVLDFSVCVNPYMPPPGIRRAMQTVNITQYPDTSATALRGKLAEKLCVSPGNIIAGNGTTELIRLIALAYFRKNDPVIIVEPTYDDYEVASRIMGARVIKYRPADSFTPEVSDIAGLVRQYQPKAIFICNPNNPTGGYLSQDDIETILHCLADGVLIFDEAYLSFVERTWSSVGLISKGNIVLLRSMTKDYGLAGLRLGYAVAREEIITTLCRVCPPWNVNALAQEVGGIVLDNDDYLQQSKKKLAQAQHYLIANLKRLGLPPITSAANFFMVKAGNAAALRSKLLRHGILVRDCASFGLPEYIRLAPRTLTECRRFIKALEAVLKTEEKGSYE